MSDSNSNSSKHLGSGPVLYVRDGSRVVEAPQADNLLVRRYPEWPDKGPVMDGQRLTLMVSKATYRIGEEVRVLHVREVLEPGRVIYPVGPKPVYEEYVDGSLATNPVPDWDDPFAPRLYDGPTLPSPGTDYNFEITAYSFAVPGIHEVRWKPVRLESNILMFEVVV